jgi:hypothetical protein
MHITLYHPTPPLARRKMATRKPILVNACQTAVASKQVVDHDPVYFIGEQCKIVRKDNICSTLLRTPFPNKRHLSMPPVHASGNTVASQTRAWEDVPGSLFHHLPTV